MNVTMDFINKIFDYSRFMPHGYCLLWRPDLIWLHVVSDLAIALAYYSIPLTFLYLLQKRHMKIPYRWVFIMFALFIFLCGTSHVMQVITLWYPVYYLQGLVKALTAAASLATALLIFPLVPTLLDKLGRVATPESRT